MNVLQRQRYAAAVTFDARDGVFIGHILGIDDMVRFHDDSVDMPKKAFAIAVRDYWQAARRSGGRRSGATAASRGSGCRPGRTPRRRWRQKRVA